MSHSHNFLMGRLGKLMVLNKIDLSIGKGEFVVILGPSGAGKSTLLNLIGGMDTPTMGSIKIDGEEIIIKKNVMEITEKIQ